MKVQYGDSCLDLRKNILWGNKFLNDDEIMEALQSLLKATPKSFFYFSRGHPQACGQVDQVCCEAGGMWGGHYVEK